MLSSRTLRVLLSLIPLTGGVEAARQAPPRAGEVEIGRPFWRVKGAFANARPGIARGIVNVIDSHHVVRAIATKNRGELWRTRLPRTGPVSSTDIVVVRGTVIVGDGWLFGLDAHSGAIRWSHSHPARAGDLDLASDDSTVYAGSYLGQGELFAIAATSGRERWVANVVPRDSIVAPGERFRVFGPVLHDGMLYACFVWWRGKRPGWIPSGGIAAVDALTGKVRWSRILPKAHPRYSTFCAVPAVAGDVVVTSTVDGQIHALHRDDGSTQWTAAPVIAYEADGLPNGDFRQMASNDRVIVAGSGSGTITAFSPDGVTAWRLPQAESRIGGTTYAFSIDDRFAFATHITGQLSAIRLKDGKQTWKTGRESLYFATRLHQDTLYAVGQGLAAIRTR